MPATQLKFRLGYAPNERFALKEHLGSQGIPVEDMVEAGLLISGDDIPVPFDRFRDRVMFPITDLRGRVIAFGGRALEKDAPAKYLNSPETPLFHKGATLYNIAAARQAAHEGAQLVAVEGYVDVIAMVTAGFAATVAPLGTALTEDQLALLWKMADEPVLCFDGDTAGLRAAYRAVDLALPRLAPGKSLKFAMLPEGQDPDDLARSGGREAIAEVDRRGTPARRHALGARNRRASVRHAGAARRARSAARTAVTASIGDEAVRKYYRQDFAARIAQLFAPRGRRSGTGRAGQRAQENWRDRPAKGGQRFGAAPRPEPGSRNTPYVVVSQQLAASPLHRGRRTVPRARGADPAGGAQPSLAAARSSRGTERARIPPSRRGEAQGRADRHRRP